METSSLASSQFSPPVREKERVRTQGAEEEEKKAQDLEFTLILTQNLVCREAPCCLGIFLKIHYFILISSPIRLSICICPQHQGQIHVGLVS